MRDARLGRLLFTSLSILLLAAQCGDPTESEDSLFGTYTAVQVNGLTLPATIYQEGNYKEEALGGSLTLNSNLSWTAVLNSRETQGTTVTPITENFGGTFSITGTTITLLQTGGTSVIGAIGSGSVTITAEDNRDDPMIIRFEK